MKPTNPLVDPLLTDFYEYSMAYAWWLNGTHEEQAVVDVHFRKNPFAGEFTVFAGVEEVLRFVSDYRFTDEQIEVVRRFMPADVDPAFFQWLKTVDCSKVRIRALREGSLAFPRVPLFIVEGPVAVVQLLEAPLLALVNYPSVVATGAARIRLAAGWDKTLMEFGLRRAPGPDGGVSASRYSYIGGFDSTSNVKAAQLFDGLRAVGTHAHSWVQSFMGLKDLKSRNIVGPDGREHDLVELVLRYREELGGNRTNEGELASFIAYAQAYPQGFLALVDTYDTLRSGVPNFLSVALALREVGYRPMGIRIDSGDLSFLSKKARQLFREAGQRNGGDLEKLIIVASNDIDEETLLALGQQGHEIDSFGIGTRLVTAGGETLGGVYKLTVAAGVPRIKVSGDSAKITLPGKKRAFRLYAGDLPTPVVDLLTLADEAAPQPGERVLCRHPFDETKRLIVIPSRVEDLYEVIWDGEPNTETVRPLNETRQYVLDQLAGFRRDHLRPVNPTPYKVSVSAKLY
ncbi:MAG TPA: nicotinate phosphoribosyltransferase, partial [Chloroflexota bacterium]|nr:nicotinate phosphoribosyltransferase [Chloroflexota bacterium]